MIVGPGGNLVDFLLKLGMKEGASRDHPGRGTTNRRFEFSNSMFEIIWVRDKNESYQGSG